MNISNRMKFKGLVDAKLRGRVTFCSSYEGGVSRVTGSKKKPVVILPGFLNTSASYKNLAGKLENLGYHCEILTVTNVDWGRVTAGGDFSFYVDRLEIAVKQLSDHYGSACSLIGHSAGGWIPRLLLGNIPYQGKIYGHSDRVDKLITLGTPHHSIEKYPFGRFDEKIVSDDPMLPPNARVSSLQYANYYYPRGDAFPGVKIVCIAGNAIYGKPDIFNTKYFFAYQCYKATCGDGYVNGDGVTPVCISHLEGATANVTLDGVWHGPIGTIDMPWYGDAIESWIHFLS
jgi:pimeloyl-ACP methyl ester carboxylesterase